MQIQGKQSASIEQRRMYEVLVSGIDWVTVSKSEQPTAHGHEEVDVLGKAGEVVRNRELGLTGVNWIVNADLEMFEASRHRGLACTGAHVHAYLSTNIYSSACWKIIGLY